MSKISSLENYSRYIENRFPQCDAMNIKSIHESCSEVNWEEPQSGLDWNCAGVMALIEAEASTQVFMRATYLEMAMEAFECGISDHPLCIVHSAMIQGLLGHHSASVNQVYQLLSQFLSWPDNYFGEISQSLIFVPESWSDRPFSISTKSPSFLTAKSGMEQVLSFASEVLWRSHLVFYNSSGRRFLQYASKFQPNSRLIQHRLGIASLMSQALEGLYDLKSVYDFNPHSMEVLQALYLSCRDRGMIEAAEHWLNLGRFHFQKDSNKLASQWTQLSVEAEYTYLVLENDILLAVEPSFRSIVTGVLLAEGEWFENEMEWWNTFIQPGMTVIDVGANVGVYTFTAARNVGPSGKVVAVEPFSSCVSRLEESRKINEMQWVKVVAAAASNVNSFAYLSIQSASELNELVNPDNPEANTLNTEKVECLQLDELRQRENLEKIDVLKVDAEGHELEVFEGSSQILTEDRPVILYENIAGSQVASPKITDFLIKNRYRICYYQPFTQQIIPVQSLNGNQEKLNLIAFPEENLQQEIDAL